MVDEIIARCGYPWLKALIPQRKLTKLISNVAERALMEIKSCQTDQIPSPVPIKKLAKSIQTKIEPILIPTKSIVHFDVRSNEKFDFDAKIQKKNPKNLVSKEIQCDLKPVMNSKISEKKPNCKDFQNQTRPKIRDVRCQTVWSRFPWDN